MNENVVSFATAELVKEPTPLKAIDFCYHDEDEMVTVLDCITLCVMVVSYSAENTRGYQMLVSDITNNAYFPTTTIFFFF